MRHKYMLAEEMKLRFAVAAILLAGLLVFASTNIAQAQWPAISSGYAVTTNWHGQDVPLGEDVFAVAGTTDIEVQKVEFIWLDPGGMVRNQNTVDVFGPYTTPSVPAGVPQEISDWAYENPGVTIWYANDTYTDPDIIGDWAVKAHFHDPTDPVKSLKGKNSDTIAIRATSFNVIPEVPFGTITILLSMFGTLGAFILKRKRRSST